MGARHLKRHRYPEQVAHPMRTALKSGQEHANKKGVYKHKLMTRGNSELTPSSERA